MLPPPAPPYKKRLPTLFHRHKNKLDDLNSPFKGHILLLLFLWITWARLSTSSQSQSSPKRPNSTDTIRDSRLDGAGLHPLHLLSHPTRLQPSGETPTGSTLCSCRLCLAVFNRLLMDHQSTGSTDMTVARVPEPSVLWQANKAPLRGTVAQCHSPPSLVNGVINETRFWDNKAVVQFVSLSLSLF